MSKKKQFSGKKTKLAKLPLTEALSRQMTEPADDSPPDAPEIISQQQAFSWESLEEGAAGLLTAAYCLVVQDLLSLRNEVPWASGAVLAAQDILPKSPLPASQVKQALRQTKEDLSDVYRILSG